MCPEMKSYITIDDAGTHRVAGTRVSLASIVHCYWAGDTPETILQSFPTLTLEGIYGAIADYLANRGPIDERIAELDKRWDEECEAAKVRNAELRARLAAARQSSPT